LFEGERLFLSTSRWGIKLLTQPENRLDLILDYRFEGFPANALPDSLTGMETRQATADLGLAYTRSTPYGSLHLELVHDAFSINQGSEARVGYSYDWTRGRLTLRPTATVYFRSAELNDYYYACGPRRRARTGPPIASLRTVRQLAVAGQRLRRLQLHLHVRGNEALTADRRVPSVRQVN
jgi:outer membrane scaffolding protein for murein synthesis (MipA/OmpV family)